MYLTQQVEIKKGHRLYSYCEDLCKNSNNLYNRTAFVVRQYVFAKEAIEKGEKPHKLTQEVYDLVESLTNDFCLINKNIRTPKKILGLAGNDFVLAKYKFLSQYVVPTDVKWLNYNVVDFVLKVSNDADYYALPSHANQHIMKQYFSDLKGYFESLKKYKANPSGFTGMPRIPGYKKSGGMCTAYLTNTVCKIKEGKYLTFPKTKEQLNIGKYGIDGTLKEVRIKPMRDSFVLNVVFDRKIAGEIIEDDAHETELSKRCKEMKTLNARAIAIDPGLDNFATVVNNFGADNFIIKGTRLKSINQMYNKAMANSRSTLKKCNGLDYSYHMDRLTKNRNNRIHDLIHKASYRITQFAKDNNVQYVVIGHNDGQKQEINIGKKNNQHFTMLPFLMLINQLRYKLHAEGIEFIVVEESYTSKACFESMDELPTYGDSAANHKFNGKRIKRGLYRANATNHIFNADVNGAANIMRKAFPNVLEWPLSMLSTPKVVLLK